MIVMVEKKKTELVKPVESKKETPAKVPEKKVTEKVEKKTKEPDFNPWTVLQYAHLAEKSMNMVEVQNLLTFIVDRKSTKHDIKEAVEKGFNVKVEKVNVEITRKGVKKAYIKLSPKDSAADIATRLGMI